MLVGSVFGVGLADEPPAAAEAEKTSASHVSFSRTVPIRASTPRLEAAAASRAKYAAIREMLESRLRTGERWERLSPAVREALRNLSVGYLEGTIDWSTVGTIDEQRSDRAVTVTVSVSAEWLASKELSLEELIAVGVRRIEGSEASFMESAAILDAIEAGDPRRESLTVAVSRLLGPVLDLSRRGGWGHASSVSGDPAVASAWLERVAATRRLVEEDRALPPIPARVYGDLSADQVRLAWRSRLEEASIDSLISLVSESLVHPAVLGIVADRFVAAGWPRTAELLRTESTEDLVVAATPPAVERDGIRKRAILAVLDVPRLSRQYLAQGAADEDCLDGPPDDFAAAVAAFDEGTEEGLVKCVMIVADAASSRPLAVDEWNLASAVMNSLEEPALARAFAMTAFRADSSHPSAGVNILRADRSLGLREEASRLIGRIETDARLNDWGRQRVAEIRGWLEEPVPTAESDGVDARDVEDSDSVPAI